MHNIDCLKQRSTTINISDLTLIFVNFDNKQLFKYRKAYTHLYYVLQNI